VVGHEWLEDSQALSEFISKQTSGQGLVYFQNLQKCQFWHKSKNPGLAGIFGGQARRSSMRTLLVGAG
jgi:hypothetical protein